MVSAGYGAVAPMSDTLRVPEVLGSMVSSSRDRISVDLRGLKAALLERSRARGVSPSEFLRVVLAEALGVNNVPAQNTCVAARARPARRVRLCLRMAGDEAQATLSAARAAGMVPGAFVAGLVAGIPVLTNGGRRTDTLAALVTSSAELATLSRNIHHLTSLLRQGSVRAAQEYREMLDGVASDVRRHLKQSSCVLADLQPRRTRSRDPAGFPNLE